MVVSLCRFDKFTENNQEIIKVTFSGSKQHITYYKNSDKKFVKLRGSARQIGFVINEDIEFFNQEFYLNKGDYLFMYSDGLKDLNNPQRENFGYSRIISILRKNINKSTEELKFLMIEQMDNWLKDDLQRDDITFIGLKM
jgi:serine phosphatase RsbU (regulator of sigma subunit)